MNVSLSGSTLTVNVDGHSDSVSLASISNPLQGVFTSEGSGSYGLGCAFTSNPIPTTTISGYGFNIADVTTDYYNAEGISFNVEQYTEFEPYSVSSMTVYNAIIGKSESEITSNLRVSYDGTGTGYFTINLYMPPASFSSVGLSQIYSQYGAYVRFRIVNGSITSYSSKYIGSATYYGNLHPHRYMVRTVEVSY